MVENLITIMNKTVGGGAPSSVASSLGESGSAAAGGKGAAKAQQDTAKGVKELGKKSFVSKMGKTLGVSLAIPTLLKQSQVFTSTFGIMFQMIGAVMDIILAPVMPIFLKAFKTMFDLSMKVAPITAKLLVGIFSAVGMGVSALKGFLDGFDWWRNTGKGWVEYALSFKWLDDIVNKLTSKDFWSQIWNWIVDSSKSILEKLVNAINPMPNSNWKMDGRDPTITGTQVERSQHALGLTSDVVAKYASDANWNKQYGFETGISADVIKSIKMDAEMIAFMKLPGEGWRGGNSAM